MSMNNSPQEPNKNKQVSSNLALYSIGGQVGCATLAIILLGLFIGIQLDKFLATKNHIFTIIFILGSAPLSLVVTYFLAMRTVKSINSQEAESKQNNPVEEEEKRE